MSSNDDKQYIPDLIKLASDKDSLQDAQHDAAAKLLDFDGETYPSDGCAITLSCELQAAGIDDFPDTFQALKAVNELLERGWKKIPVGQQQPGDVGTTVFGGVPHHGIDHVYVVLKILNHDEMVIADNQSHAPHFRFASGKGKSPTRFFLRAPAAE